MNTKISNGMKFKKILSFIIVIFLIFVFCYFLIKKNISLKKIDSTEEFKSFQNDTVSSKAEISSIEYVKIGGQMVKVELADTPDPQIRGLSGRNILKEDEGMLFIFPEPQMNYFWMKEMNFPIDIIWINEDFKIIYLEKSLLSESYPKTFGPNEKSKYVLEVLAGFSEKNNLEKNDQVQFLP